MWILAQMERLDEDSRLESDEGILVTVATGSWFPGSVAYNPNYPLLFDRYEEDYGCNLVGEGLDADPV